MKILVFSDLHGWYANRLPNVKVDAVFILGDVSWSEVRNIDEAYSCPKFGVLGNHDVPELFAGTSITHVHGKTVKWEGFTIAGFDGCPVYNQKGHGQYREVDVKKALEGLGERVDIFLAHSNPQWEPNVNTKDSHRGFSAFKTFIEQKRPSYFFHGHLHVNETQKMGRTQVICTHGYAIYDINQ